MINIKEINFATVNEDNFVTIGNDSGELQFNASDSLALNLCRVMNDPATRKALDSILSACTENEISLNTVLKNVNAIAAKRSDRDEFNKTVAQNPFTDSATHGVYTFGKIGSKYCFRYAEGLQCKSTAYTFFKKRREEIGGFKWDGTIAAWVCNTQADAKRLASAFDADAKKKA